MQLPVLTNVTADIIPSKEDIKGLLGKQVVSPVKWEATVRRLIAEGVDTFIEIGPGRALCGFIGRISKEVRALNAEDMDSLEKTLSTLEESAC